MSFNLFTQVIEINPDGAFGTFLEFLYVFIIGSFLGYIAEVLFRRFVSMKRWINPGFLRGPCLPLYGFGLGTLHLICVYTFQYLCDPSTVPAYYSSLAIGNGPLPFFLFSNWKWTFTISGSLFNFDCLNWSRNDFN